MLQAIYGGTIVHAVFIQDESSKVRCSIFRERQRDRQSKKKIPTLLIHQGQMWKNAFCYQRLNLFYNSLRTAACFCFHNIKQAYRKPLPSEISENLTDATDTQLAV